MKKTIKKAVKAVKKTVKKETPVVDTRVKEPEAEAKLSPEYDFDMPLSKQRHLR